MTVRTAREAFTSSTAALDRVTEKACKFLHLGAKMHYKTARLVPWIPPLEQTIVRICMKDFGLGGSGCSSDWFLERSEFVSDQISASSHTCLGDP